MSSQAHLHQVGAPSGARFIASTEAVADGSPSGPSGAPPASPQRPGKPKARAEKSLPTDRLSFDKQLGVLEGVAQQSGNAKRPVTAEDMSAAIQLRGLTGGLNSKFFRDCGWFESTGRGSYTATKPLLEYYRRIAVDKTAQAKVEAKGFLCESIRDTWFWNELEPLLSTGEVVESRALYILSKAAATSEHTSQLQTILAWLEWVGLVERDGEIVRLAGAGNHGTDVSDTDRHELLGPDEATDVQIEVPAEELVDEVKPAVEPLDEPGDTEALFSFNMSIRITADDAAKLTDQQMQSVLDFAEKMRR